MMQNYHSGDIVLMTLQFTAGTGAKRRPAIVLLDTGDADMIVAPITSRAGRAIFDVNLAEWQQAGLLLPSIVRVHKPTTAEKRLVERTLGTLTADDWAQVRAKVLELWAGI
jgi:mRNA interferase MazF